MPKYYIRITKCYDSILARIRYRKWGIFYYIEKTHKYPFIENNKGDIWYPSDSFSKLNLMIVFKLNKKLIRIVLRDLEFALYLDNKLIF